MQVVVDDLLTNYQDVGKGKAVLLLHGWGDSLETWHSLQSNLAKNYRVVSVDLPGFGKTEIPKTVWGLENYADFLGKFLIKINSSNLQAVVGHSNGGAVAIKALSVGAIKADKLVLLASAGVRDKQKARKLAIKAVAKTGKAATFWLPSDQKKKLQKKLYGVVGSDMLVAPHLQETFKKTVSQDVQADAKQVIIPTLLIYAENDKAVPVSYGQILSGLIKDSKLVVLPDSGHFLHHDQTAKVEKLVEDFLK